MDFLRSIPNVSQSSSELSPSEFPSVESEYEDPITQLAREAKQQPFITKESLQKSLEHRQRALQQDQTWDQYLVFTSVPAAQYSRLSDDRSRISKYSRLLYNAEMRILIAKVMPNPAHELAIRSFDSLIFLELRAMNVHNDVWPFGSTTVTVGNWKKEADCCWAPASTNVRLSFVVEVGLLESARRLALDARGWLETHSSSVKLVVTISIKPNNPEIVLHRWELVSLGHGVLTRSSPLSARRTASLKLSRTNDATIVTGESYMNGTNTATTQLDLSFDKVVGRPPHRPLEKDLKISEQELRSFAEKIWSAQSLL
ncbi:uncharacterized protein N7511_005407 [Penicillium nucicola]|uniref:uncharacterized protein n=1 Tax=Penicillium nucicola TaxID=1850975 RepID=UPI0025455565|nr:uncharacterized protein N7511_005407 [Penicillium nucicola]KAJ5762025.1 hypothetical protein N7511_005407 [Penicillium nucicola]